jgi:hypothetical protein
VHIAHEEKLAGFIMITAQYLAMTINAKTIYFPDLQLTVERHIIWVNGLLLTEAKIPSRHFVKSIATMHQTEGTIPLRFENEKSADLQEIVSR